MPRTPKFHRETALNNALKLFWRKGYHATSMKDIEEEMDMRPGSIYAAFGNKESLFKETLEEYSVLAANDFKQTLAQKSSVLQGLSLYLRNLAVMNATCEPTKACMLVKTLLEFTPEDKAFSDPARSYLEEFEQLFTETFELAQQRGEIGRSQSPERLARVLQTNIIGLRTMVRRGLTQSQLESLADDIVVRIIPSS
ncbi:helix-turn-helix domain-containing protein [Idiomarina sp. HP20-50]|uniref:TetR/AcrR family transcriptional regulator n=1 Tax=Idiomarina sp. HP20-50 TaxID=3070813 RepID=UPI00294AE348|nr:helix-turn-helix domain-containing protein [Idiomarina sp. HP20-50]MDV6316727.1 helix-turn-helix domain-containing protein [Idiomarina sp. HP20-50]